MNDRDPSIPAEWHAIARLHGRVKLVPGGWYLVAVEAWTALNVIAGWLS